MQGVDLIITITDRSRADQFASWFRSRGISLVLTSLGQGTAIQFQLLTSQAGQLFFPAFTSWEELRKLCGPKNQQTLLLSFDDYAAMILRDHRAAGFVLDPFGCCLSFDRAMTEHLVQRKAEQSPKKP